MVWTGNETKNNNKNIEISIQLLKVFSIHELVVFWQYVHSKSKSKYGNPGNLITLWVSILRIN